GGYNSTDGDPAGGRHDVIARTRGLAAGTGYRRGARPVVRGAGAVGGGHQGVSPRLRQGNSDWGHGGRAPPTRWDNPSVSAAVAGAWYNARTDRFVGIAGLDHLRGDFDAHSVSARAEGGWRLGSTTLGFTPYAAVQVQSVSTPTYTEAALTGLNTFALTYGSHSATDTRTELGAWADTRYALDNGASVLLRGRAASVHDFAPDRR